VEPNEALHCQIMCKQTRERSTTEVILTQSSFLGTLSIIGFFKEAQAFLLSKKEAPNLVDPVYQAVLNHHVAHKQ
jgi:hypothetical protein